MNWRDLPSLNALRAFAALAEHGSYSAAGAALNVTHAAVLQQVKALEAHLAVPLVIREGRKISLTAEGHALARDLKDGFQRIMDGVAALSDAATSRPVQVTMSPAFATRWLMPRLADFQTRYPEITLLLNPTGQFVDLAPGGMDVAIRYGRQDWLDGPVDTLIPVDLAVVGRADLLKAPETLSPRDLLHRPWLQELGTNEVGAWFDQHGVRPQPAPQITHMPGNLIMDAVRRGDGITYTVREWVAEELRSGELIEVFPEKAVGQFYIHTDGASPRPPVRTFIRWLRRQAGKPVG